MGRIDARTATVIARAVAAIRVAIGVGTLLAPKLAARVLLREQPPAAAMPLLRMFGGREIALGLGATLAASRGPGALRGWVEAGALVDGFDVVALAADRGRGLRALPRWGALVGATVAAGSAPVLARALGRR